MRLYTGNRRGANERRGFFFLGPYLSGFRPFSDQFPPFLKKYFRKIIFDCLEIFNNSGKTN